MIFIDRDNGESELLTTEEFRMRYPEVYKSLHRPAPRKWREVGDALRRNRQDKDMTMREVAAKMGWKVSEVCDLERGLMEPTMARINLFHQALGIGEKHA